MTMNAADWDRFFDSNFNQGLSRINRLAAQKRAEELRDEERSYRDAREQRIYDRNRRDQLEDAERRYQRNLDLIDERIDREFASLKRRDAYEREQELKRKREELGLPDNATAAEIMQAQRDQEKRQVEEMYKMETTLLLGRNEAMAGQKMDPESSVSRLREDEREKAREDSLVPFRAQQEAKKEERKRIANFVEERTPEVEELANSLVLNEQLRMRLSEEDQKTIERGIKKNKTPAVIRAQLSPGGRDLIDGLARSQQTQTMMGLAEVAPLLAWMDEGDRIADRVDSRGGYGGGTGNLDAYVDTLVGEEGREAPVSSGRDRGIVFKWGDKTKRVSGDDLKSAIKSGVNTLLPLPGRLPNLRKAGSEYANAASNVADAVSAGPEIRELLSLGVGKPDQPPRVDIRKEAPPNENDRYKMLLKEYSNPLLPEYRKRQLEEELERMQSTLTFDYPW